MKAPHVKNLLGIVFVGFAIAMHGPAHAGQKCTQKSFKGSYGFSQLGSFVGLAPTPVPAAAVGVFSLDGKGNMNGSEVVSVGGQFISSTFVGTYEVRANCTGTASWTLEFANGALPQTQTAELVATDDDKSIYILITDPGAVFVGTARKQ